MKTTPKDFFFHLGATIALYAATISLINLSLAVINYFTPDKLAGDFYGNPIAWHVSMLVVFIPTLYILEWLIGKDVKVSPEKKDLWISRWRGYLTLFLTGIVILGDIATLINTYLNGEISMRLVWKVLAVLVISGVIFAYFLIQKSSVRKSLAWAGIIILLAAIVGGFAAVGSPSSQRNARLDAQRVNDLSGIQSQLIYSYWMQKGSLPANLSDLNNEIAGYIIPTDPDTEAPYEYSVKDKLSFQLCATFGLDTKDVKGRGEYGYGGGISYPAYVMRDSVSTSYPGSSGNDVWAHKAGRTCFDRTIDPEIYKVNPPQTEKSEAAIVK